VAALLVFVLVALGFLAVFSVFVGDWSAGGQKAVQRQRRARRLILVVLAVLVAAFLAIAWSGGYATI
jgi:hypothetical protein